MKKIRVPGWAKGAQHDEVVAVLWDYLIEKHEKHAHRGLVWLRRHAERIEPVHYQFIVDMITLVEEPERQAFVELVDCLVELGVYPSGPEMAYVENAIRTRGYGVYREEITKAPPIYQRLRTLIAEAPRHRVGVPTTTYRTWPHVMIGGGRLSITQVRWRNDHLASLGWTQRRKAGGYSGLWFPPPVAQRRSSG